MKRILIALLICFTVSSYAQTSFTLDSAKFAAYLKERSKSLELKLYNMAMAGELKAYKTDSLASFYTPEEVVERGVITSIIQRPTEFPNEFRDSVIVSLFNPEKDLLGQGFHTIITNPTPETITKTLHGLSIIFRPQIDGLPLPREPLCVFSWSDIKAKLPKADIEFLEQLYFLKALEPMQEGTDYISSNEHIWGEAVVSGIVRHYTSDKDCHHIARILYYNFQWRLIRIWPENEKVFVNRQNKQLTSREDLGCRYFIFEKVQVPTEFEGEFRDTTFSTCLEFDDAGFMFVHDTKGIREVIFEFSGYKDIFKPEAVKESYSISWVEIKKRHPNKWMVWFIEDYYKELKN